ncbi:hypothetical protein BDW22DRAFT_1429242 [Trametopsis cervina]|nr:hypothetical protein BDW22DRAFT_1429242 [Trametopsis cervina]
MSSSSEGHVVGNPEPPEHISSSRPRPVRHRLRRATSVAIWDRGAYTLQRTSTVQQPVLDYERKAQSLVSFASNRHQRSSTSLDLTVDINHDVVLPTREEADTIPEGEEVSPFIFKLITPDRIMGKKYMRTDPKEYVGEVPRISAFQTTFLPRPNAIPENGAFVWKPCQSPEGNLYFHDVEKNVMTFIDLYGPSYLEGVSGLAQFLLPKIQQEQATPDDAEIVIVLEDLGSACEFVYGYYLASWKRQCVFWLKDVDYEFVTRGGRICTTASHIGNCHSSANVGFLAIQSINVDSPHRTVAQIASYISSVLSLFDCLVCLVLARQYQYSQRFAIRNLGDFVDCRQYQRFVLESVAVTFSLPTALFIWSALTFFAALMIAFFWQTSLATRVSLGIVLVISFSITAVLLTPDWKSRQETGTGSISLDQSSDDPSRVGAVSGNKLLPVPQKERVIIWFGY